MKKHLKIIFTLLPFKKQLFTLLKKWWAPPPGIYQHLYFKGVFTVKVDGGTFCIRHEGHTIENELFWNGIGGCWEKNSLQIWSALAKNAEVIFDIGANTGVYSLVAKTVNRKSSVHAFEPFPAIYRTLLQNTSINGYDITCNCLAISSYRGQGVIYSEDPDFAYSVTVNRNLWAAGEKVHEIPIQTTTLREYIEENSIRKIDLMKIDVETHEPEVLEGFAQYLSLFKPVLLMEILNREVSEKLRSFFPPGQFDFYNIDEGRGIKKVPELSKSDGFNFLIVPVEKSALIGGAGMLAAHQWRA